MVQGAGGSRGRAGSVVSLSADHEGTTGAAADAREVTVCPGCGRPTRPVGLKTVKHLLEPRIAHSVWGEGFSHCSAPDCEVYYVRPRPGDADVDTAAPGLEVYTAEHIKERARPRAGGVDRLVCHCFGYTVGDIADDARAGGVIPGLIAAEVRAGMCACEVLNPGGG
jgi:hypothetical protein